MIILCFYDVIPCCVPLLCECACVDLTKRYLKRVALRYKPSNQEFWGGNFYFFKSPK